MTDARIRLSAGDLRLELAPDVGGSVAAFGVERAEGYTPLFRSAPESLTDALDAGCFPLVPYVNRVRDGRFTCDRRIVQIAPMAGHRHPLHGDGWRNPWTVVKTSALSVELLYRHAASDWPWDYEARQRMDMDAEGLTWRLSCRNLSAEPMPCGLGLHPYFPCTDATVLDTAVEWAWSIDAEVMPVERVPAQGRYDLRQRRICAQDLDNGFQGWSGDARIVWPDQGYGLEFTCPDATYFQVYSPPSGGVFVAEPVTHANAALNLPQAQWRNAGLIMLRQGEEAEIVTRFTVAEIA